MEKIKPTWYQNHNGELIDLNEFKHIQFLGPNEDGNCMIRAFKEIVHNLEDPNTEVPEFTVINWCLPEEIEVKRADILTLN